MNQKYAVVKQASPFQFTMFHESFEEAKAEAVRLAEKEKGKRFFILKMMAYADLAPTPVEFVELD